jgi:hypothetical protein
MQNCPQPPVLCRPAFITAFASSATSLYSSVPESRAHQASTSVADTASSASAESWLPYRCPSAAYQGLSNPPSSLIIGVVQSAAVKASTTTEPRPALPTTHHVRSDHLELPFDTVCAQVACNSIEVVMHSSIRDFWGLATCNSRRATSEIRFPATCMTHASFLKIRVLIGPENLRLSNLSMAVDNVWL